MIREVVNVLIDGRDQEDLTPDLVEIEVEEHVASASVFRVRLAIGTRADGSWTLLDDRRFAPWRRLAIRAGYPEHNEVVIDGYVTHVAVSVPDDATVEVSGADASALMDLEDRQAAWPNKKDSEIAQEVFSSYGLSWEVEDTVARQGAEVATVLQSESDIRFLRRLAARNGFECHVHGSKGFFRSPNLQDPPQKVLAVAFGAETNVTSLAFEIDGTPPTALAVRRVDPMEKRVEEESLEDLPRRKLGKRALAALQADARRGRRLLKQRGPASAQQMKALLRGGYQAAGEFVTLSGEVDARAYGAVLRPRRLVTVKGAGDLLSGLYYVTRVRHHFTTTGYTQRFEAVRNGVGVLGDEPFDARPALAPVAAGTGAPSVPSGNRVLPAQQSGTTLRGGA